MITLHYIVSKFHFRNKLQEREKKGESKKKALSDFPSFTLK